MQLLTVGKVAQFNFNVILIRAIYLTTSDKEKQPAHTHTPTHKTAF